MTGKAPLLHQIICPTLHLSTRTAYGVCSIYNDLQIATAAETSFSASRRTADSVVVTRDTVSHNVIVYGTSPLHHPQPRFAGRTTDVMMVSGDSMRTYEGYTLHHDISRLDLAGRGLAQFLDGVMDTRDHLLVTPSPFCWSGSFRVPDEDKEKLQEESGTHTTLSLLSDNDATVRAPSDNALTNTQRSLGIAVHHLCAVTSICPLVDCAPVHTGSGYAFKFFVRLPLRASSSRRSSWLSPYLQKMKRSY